MLLRSHEVKMQLRFDSTNDKSDAKTHDAKGDESEEKYESKQKAMNKGL